MIKLSVVIPARNEWPNVVHTVYSILHAWETSYEALGWKEDEIEIIIVDNCSTDRGYPRTAVTGTTSYLMPRGIFSNRYLRVVYEPKAGNHSARNRGVEKARGKYIFLSDAHMSYNPRYFEYMVKAQRESGGIVHSPIGWLGAYPPKEASLGYQYTLKLGEEWKGTWAQRCLSQDDWFYIPALGHCSLLFRKDQFTDFKGYQENHRTYGGGEMYLNMKWWMFDSTVVCEPRAIGYHLASERGYSYNHDDYIGNIFACMYALGIDDWLERSYINYLRKGRKEVLDRMMMRAERDQSDRRAFVEKRRKHTFNEILIDRPWDRLNIAKFGSSNCGLSIFHDTWLPLLEGTPAKQAYADSRYQKDLEVFINTHLDEFVYKRER